MTKYQQAKRMLLEVAREAKKSKPNDKPYVRQSINDHADYLCKSLNLTDHQRELLSNFACKLHPKN